MKTKQGLSFLSFLLMGLFIFLGGLKTAIAADTPSSSNQNMSVKKEARIIAVVMIVNKNEINLAKEALTKATSPEVKQYAKMLQEQHTQNFKESLILGHKLGITRVELAHALSLEGALQKAGAKELHTLSSLKGKDFEKGYIDAMVKGHTKVLNMIDNDLLKNASDPALNKFLVGTRAHIADHLEQGKKIQKEVH